MSSWNPRANELFVRALELPTEERAAFLDRECGDAELRNAVDTLLKAHEQAGTFLVDPHPAAIPTGTFGDPTRDAELPSTAAHTPTHAVGAIVAGKYKLLQQIGEGGMGTVWMAEQKEPVKRKVAVKLIRVERGSSATILARFEAERQAIALMNHPHIAKLLDAGTTDDCGAGVPPAYVAAGGTPAPQGRPFFVMELVKGIPLTEYCDTHKLPIGERLNLFMQICSAVQHAHQKGIIHRDLKPTNILVESHDGKPVPKVIDFGLAKATSGMQLTEHTLFTGFGSVMGTPLYMAPEQATFNAIDVDTRADIYALGVILYELLTGTTPIEKAKLKKAALEEMLRIIREEEAPTPSHRLSTSEGTPSAAAVRGMEPAKLGRFVKGELDWIVMKALSKERDRRYETANGFAKDVERFLNHEPVLAGPPSVGYRLRKAYRRNKGRVLAATAFLLLLVTAVIVSSWLAVLAKRAEGVADEKRKEADENAREAMLMGAKFEGAMIAANEHRISAERNALSLRVDLDLVELAQDQRVGLLQLARTRREIADRYELFRKLRTLTGEEDLIELGEFVTAAVLAVGQEFTTLLPPITHDGSEIVWHMVSPDGRTLLTEGRDGRVCLWEARTARRIATLREGDDRVLHCGYAPDGRTAFTADRAGVTRVWEAVTGKLRAKTDPHARRYDLPKSWTAGQNPSLDTEMRKNYSHATSIAADRVLTKRVVIRQEESEQQVTWEGPVELWDATNGRRIAQLDQPGHSAEHFEFVSETKWITTTEGDSTVLVFAAEDGSLAARLSHPAEEAVIRYVASPSGKYIATLARPAGTNPTLRVWDTATWKTVSRHEVATNSAMVQFWSDELIGVALLGFGYGSWSVFAPGRPEMLYAMNYDDAAGVRVFGEHMLTAQGKVFDARTGRRLPPPKGRRFHPALAQFASDGRFAPCSLPRVGVFGSEIGHGLIDTRTEKSFSVRSEGPAIGDGIRLEGRVFSDGSKFLSGVWPVDGTLRLWSLPMDSRTEIPADRLELWAQVAVRGELADDGTFKKWDEATWERKRRELAAVPPPDPNFSFPDHLAHDPLHWLRSECQSAGENWLPLARELLRRSDAAGDAAEAARWRREIDRLLPEPAPPPRERK